LHWGSLLCIGLGSLPLPFFSSFLSLLFSLLFFLFFPPLFWGLCLALGAFALRWLSQRVSNFVAPWFLDVESRDKHVKRSRYKNGWLVKVDPKL